MAINSIQDFITGKKPPQYLLRGTGSSGAAGYWRDMWMYPGYPATGNDVTGSGGGTTYNSATAGAFPFTNAAENKEIKLFKMNFSFYNNFCGSLMIIDRLWYTMVDSSGTALAMSTTTPQTINSVAWPTRESSGEGVYIAFVSPGGLGSGTSNARISYTNTANVSGRVGNAPNTITGNPISGHMIFFDLEAGDTGVKSVQNVEFYDSTIASGGAKLLAFKPLWMGGFYGKNSKAQIEPISCPLATLKNDSCMNIITYHTTTSHASFAMSLTYSEN